MVSEQTMTRQEATERALEACRAVLLEIIPADWAPYGFGSYCPILCEEAWEAIRAAEAAGVVFDDQRDRDEECEAAV